MSLYRTAAVFVAALALSACSDTLSPVTDPVDAPSVRGDVGVTVARFRCTATGTDLQCASADPAPSADGARRIILGSGRVKLRSFNVAYDSATEDFRADITVQNLQPYPIGTADGTNLAFIKAFFDQGPTVTAYTVPGDTGTAYVGNADGTCNCSGPAQPYFNYPQILQTNQVSAAKTWHWHIPRSVATWSFLLYVFTRFPGEVDVPATPPDSVPESVYDSTKIVYGDAVLGGPLIRNLVLIQFTPGATAEDRLAALNWTNGTIVGGRSPTGGQNGTYVVRLRNDSTTGELRTAITRLDRLPQVASASPEYVFDPAEMGDFVKPTDASPDWTSTTYSLNPDSTSSSTTWPATWGLSAIAAPWAWGCTVGSAAVPVAVVDVGFRAHGDMTNVVNTDWQADTPNNHGLIVASVLGANGNDSSGIAGVMWRSSIKYFGVTHASPLRRFLGLDEVHLAVWNAMKSGSRIINMSIGLRYSAIVNGQKVLVAPTGTAGEYARARRVGKSFGTAVQAALHTANDPLFVITAGNYGLDATLNGYPNGLSVIGDRLLVVAAAAPTSRGNGDFNGSFTMASFNPTGIDKGSDYGTQVEIAAPGWNVGTLTNLPTPVLQSGTSVAAPYVAGTAGLMLALDARLTAAELKQLLLQGGTTGGRAIRNGPGANALPIPLLNAYESLRLVAQRSGAGLCGNPLWQDSVGGIVAKRGAAWGGSSETLFTEAGKTGISAQHSTGIVSFTDLTAWTWDGRAWNRGITGAAVDNATNLSKTARSHGGDTVITVTRKTGADARFDELFDVKLNGAVIATIHGPRVRNTGSVQRCVVWDTSGSEWTDCYSYYGTYSSRVTSTFSVSYSSARNQIALSVARDSAAAKIEEGYYFYDGYFQRNYSFDKYTYDTWTYLIPVATPTQYDSVYTPQREANNVGFSDDGRNIVLRRILRSQNVTFTPLQTTSLNVLGCDATWATMQGNTAYSTLFSTPVSHIGTCYSDATIAP
jgi:hypothetical protein